MGEFVTVDLFKLGSLVAEEATFHWLGCFQGRMMFQPDLCNDSDFSEKEVGSLAEFSW